MAIHYVEASDVRAYRVDGSISPRIEIRDRLVILAAQVKRVFPLSKPSEFLSLQDASGKELAVLKSTDGLDSDTSAIFAAELDRRYFTPVITRVNDLEQESGMWRFNVDTQRGSIEFYVRNWRDNGFEISPNRWQIHTVDGARFDIPDLSELDADSRKRMARLL